MTWQAYPKYKDSGVKWLGEIPEHWGARRLKYVSSLNDETLGETTDPDFELLYVDISSVDAIAGIQHKENLVFQDAPSRARRRVRHGDVIVSTVRTYLRAIAPIVEPEENLIVSTGFAVVRPTNDLESRFAFYALRAPYFVEAVVANSVGVSYPAINSSELATLFLALPPEDEQRAIAAFLDRKTERMDALIARKERQIELLQEKRAALISHAVTKGLDSNAPMKDSGVEWLGEIPAHWEVTRLKHISPKQSVGLVINPSTYVDPDGDVSFFFGADIGEGHISTENARRITRESNYHLSQSMLNAGDLVTVRVGYPGVTAVVPPELESSNCASMMIIRRSPKFVSQWLCYAMNSVIGRSQVEIVQYGAAQKQFNISHAVGFLFPVPPYEEQCQITEYLDAKTEATELLIEKVELSILNLREYRTALISAAVTGKIDVRP